MEKDTAMATHTDDVPQKQPLITKQKLIDHFKRFWWLHLIIFCCCVLIIALPLVYVGYPNIAQGIVNGATINLMSQSFYNPTPTTVGLKLQANVSTHSIFHAHVDAWNGTLYQDGSDSPLLSFEVPAYLTTPGVQINVDTTCTILDQTAFENFTSTGFSASSFKVYLKGKGGLKLGALPHITINYDKQIIIPGLDGLQSLQTSNLLLDNSKNPPPGVDATGNVTINNNSPLNLTLGDAQFDLYANGSIALGNATIPDLVLMPGNHTYPLLLNTDLSVLLELVAMPQYHCGKFPVTVVGTKVSYDGTDIPYWTYAFANNNVSTIVDVYSTFAALNLTSNLGTCST